MNFSLLERSAESDWETMKGDVVQPGSTKGANAASRTAAVGHVHTKLQTASVHRMKAQSDVDCMSESDMKRKSLKLTKYVCDSMTNTWSEILLGGKNDLFLPVFS